MAFLLDNGVAQLMGQVIRVNEEFTSAMTLIQRQHTG